MCPYASIYIGCLLLANTHLFEAVFMGKYLSWVYDEDVSEHSFNTTCPWRPTQSIVLLTYENVNILL